MNIIQKEPNPSGAYPPIQSWNGEVPPETHYKITCDTTEFFNGFIIPTVKDGKVSSYVCNVEAWEAWKTVPIEKQRADMLAGLNGLCSGAIYYGVDIGNLHYNFTATTQTNLETIARRIDGGTTSVLYRADNEAEQRVYTAQEMRVIIDTKDEWIAVNTNYYEKLKAWINRETDTTTLEAIHYGSALPDDLMQDLVTKLDSVGIDIRKYAAMFS